MLIVVLDWFELLFKHVSAASAITNDRITIEK
jgi:hypothetical protein